MIIANTQKIELVQRVGMQDHIFRQYDIRGKVGTEFTVESVYDLGRALAVYCKQLVPSLKTIAVGADGRTHSPAIKEQLCKALVDSGLDVVFIGTCPTPVLYFSQYHLPVQAGIMITASHNGKEYNGFKIVLEKRSIWGKQLQEVKELVHRRAALTPSSKGSYSDHVMIDEYVAWLKDHFKHLIGMKRSAIIDCGNGAAGTVMPQLIKAMEWESVDLLYPEVDGTYPNHEADPVVLANMQDVKKILQSGDYSVGLGLDGDCDRMAPMTVSGDLIPGDKLLSLFSQHIAQSSPNAAVVFDIKCSSGLPELLTQWGMQPVVSPSGHSNIKECMRDHDAVLAGELSCHFFFKDRYYGYDDGIYAALRLFEMLESSGKSLQDLLQVFPKKYSTPEIRIDCAQDRMDMVVKQVANSFVARPDVTLSTLDGIRIATNDGWSLLRASNTQPVLCVRFEAHTPEGLQRLEHDLISAMRPYCDVTQLEKELLISNVG